MYILSKSQRNGNAILPECQKQKNGRWEQRFSLYIRQIRFKKISNSAVLFSFGSDYNKISESVTDRQQFNGTKLTTEFAKYILTCFIINKTKWNKMPLSSNTICQSARNDISIFDIKNTTQNDWKSSFHLQGT